MRCLEGELFLLPKTAAQPSHVSKSGLSQGSSSISFEVGLGLSTTVLSAAVLSDELEEESFDPSSL